MSAKRWPEVGDIVEVYTGEYFEDAEVIAESFTHHPENPQYELEDVPDPTSPKRTLGQQLVLTHTIKSFKEWHATVRTESGEQIELRQQGSKIPEGYPNWKHSRKKSLDA